MHLVLDDINEIYFWADDNDEAIALSPHFDYEEDAIQWYGTVAKHIFEEFDVQPAPR